MHARARARFRNFSLRVPAVLGVKLRRNISFDILKLLPNILGVQSCDEDSRAERAPRENADLRIDGIAARAAFPMNCINRQIGQEALN